MRSFQKHLVMLDGDALTMSHPALRRSLEIARQQPAKLVLATIVEHPDSPLKRFEDLMTTKELTELVQQRRMDELETLASQIRADGIDVQIEVPIGRGFVETIKLVLRYGFDVVIKRALMDSDRLLPDDLHLLRKCPCPVWIIRDDNNIGRVVAAIDLSSEETETGKLLNQKILTIASELSQFHETELKVLSCWNMFGEDALANSAFLKVDKDKLAKILEAEQQTRQKLFEELTAPYGIEPSQLVLEKGMARTIIPEYVNSHQCNTVVMGTVGRTGIPGMFIGNTAEAVLSAIDSSVVAVKPEGFESPVR